MEIKDINNNKIVKFNPKKVNCPTCKKKSLDPYTPFCSKKCSDIDLKKWLFKENYTNLDSK